MSKIIAGRFETQAEADAAAVSLAEEADGVWRDGIWEDFDPTVLPRRPVPDDRR